MHYVHCALILIALIEHVHLLGIQCTEMFPLTKGCAVLGYDGNLPWPLGKLMLSVVHYGIVVVLNAKTVN